MAIRNVKAKSHEKLDATNVQKVIDLLEQESPITKKEACEILNIRYNTTRLQKIIDEHLEMTAFREKRKAKIVVKAQLKQRYVMLYSLTLKGRTSPTLQSHCIGQILL